MKELEDCLKQVVHYSKIVMKLEQFIKNCNEIKSKFSTQVYETFAQCLTVYLRYYKESLNKIGVELIKKGELYIKKGSRHYEKLIWNFLEQKLTLVDFLCTIRSKFFTNLDLLNLILKLVNRDLNRPSYAKSINIILVIHKYLIDSYSSHNYAKIEAKFLLWLFVMLIKPFLDWVDTFMREGVFLDTRNELGFKRNINIPLDNVEYWKHGYDFLLDSSQLVSELPLFMRIILICSFKICKHMEIITLLGNYHQKSNIYVNFVEKMKFGCPFLAESKEKSELEKTIEIMNRSSWEIETSKRNSAYTILDINFKKLAYTDSTIIRKSLHGVATIESLFETDFNIAHNDPMNEANLNLEKLIENVLHECLIEHVEYSSRILIEKVRLYEHITVYYLIFFF